MMCPIHNAIKFPREKIKSGKPASLETQPISAEMYTFQFSYHVFIINVYPSYLSGY